MKALFVSVPAAIVIYFFGFLMIFSLFMSGFVSIVVPSLTSAVLLSSMVVSIAIPEQREKPTFK